MKKFTAVLICIAMLLSVSVSAFASDWDVLMTRYNSYDATVEFGMELNKPLECLATLKDDASFDVKHLVEELIKAKFTAKIQAEMSDDAKEAKMAMAINSNVPVNLSEDLKFGADVTVYVWLEYDFTNTENPTYYIIVKNPLTGKYMYMDYLAVMQEALGVVEPSDILNETFGKVDMKAGVEEITALAKALYEKNATLTKSGDEYTVKFTNDGIIDMVFGLLEGYFDTEYAKSLGDDYATLFPGDFEAEAVRAMIKGLGIFGENDALTMKIKMNKSGQIAESEEKIHLDFNIYELARALGAQEDDLYPSTKENLDIDITFNSKTVYSKINEENVVSIPVLTEENSVSLLDILGLTNDDYDYDDDYYYDYQPEKFRDYTAGKVDRGGMYVDFEEFLDSAAWDEDNLQGTVAQSETGDILITLKSDNFEEVTVKGNINSDEYTLSGTQLWGRKPFILADEYNWETYSADKKVYVNIDVLNYILGCQIESMTVYLIDENGITLTEPEYSFEIVRPNPGYVDEPYTVE